MKTKLLALLLLVAILTTMLASCEVLEFVNHMLNIFGPGDDSDTNIDLDINIGGTTAHVHTEGVLPATESTCTTHGLTEGRYCTSCEKVLVPQGEAPLKAHTYDNSVDRYCNVCGNERDIDCSHQGTTEFLSAKESTCTEAGLTQGVKCTLCGEIIVAQESLPLKDHVSSDWIIDEEATTEKEGLKHIECTVCGNIIYQSTIPKILPSSEGLEYTLNSDKKSYSVTGIGTCTSKAILISNTYEGKPVTKIANYAFKGCKSIVSITLPSSIETIGSGAFNNCSSLKDVYFQGDIKDWINISFNDEYSNPMTYGANLYFNNELVTNLIIPDSTTKINNYAFRGCTSIVNITIPNSVTYIGTYAFYKCSSLLGVDIPDSVTDIRIYAFAYCTSLQKLSISDSITLIREGIFWHCENLTELYIGNSVRNIDDYAFLSCKSLKTLTIPNSVTQINYQSFGECVSLTNVEFGNSIESIGQKAFENCSSLQNINLPSSLVTIDSNAFTGCDSITNISIPDSVTTIGSESFKNCTTLETIEIGKSVTSIGDSAFGDCPKLINIAVDSENNYYKSIDGNLYSKDEKIFIKYAVAKPDNSFVIPDTVTTIKSCAFKASKLLCSITIPKSVTSIGAGAFWNCTLLQNIELPNITIINTYLFAGCSSLKSIVIPDSVESIEYYAFSKCSLLENVTIGNSVKTIGEGAFSGCGFTTIKIPNSVTTIEQNAFQYCNSLNSIVIPLSVTNIGYGAFFLANASLKIYCEASSKPSGWVSTWNIEDRPVVWNYTGN